MSVQWFSAHLPHVSGILQDDDMCPNLWHLKHLVTNTCALFVFCWSEEQMVDEHAIFKCTFNYGAFCHFDIRFLDEASDFDILRRGAKLVRKLFSYGVLCYCGIHALRSRVVCLVGQIVSLTSPLVGSFYRTTLLL